MNVEGDFKRIGAFQAAGETVFPLLGWFYLNGNHAKEGTRPKVWGQVFKIQSEQGVVHRRLRYRMNLPKDCIGLDYDSWRELQVGRSGKDGGDQRDDGALHLVICRDGNPFHRIGLDHPDPGLRSAAWLGLLGLALGAISVGLGVLSVVLSCPAPGK